jgi:hypothetical protein
MAELRVGFGAELFAPKRRFIVAVEEIVPVYSGGKGVVPE